MTEAQYLYELFKLYKDRQFMVELIVEHGPEHNFWLEGAVASPPTAGEELKKIDQQIFDLMREIYEDENDIFSDFQGNLSITLDKVLEMLEANT